MTRFYCPKCNSPAVMADKPGKVPGNTLRCECQACHYIGENHEFALMVDHPAAANLRTNQRQLDMDGCEVGVSRQAVEEALIGFDRLIAALTKICCIRAVDTPEGAWRSDLQQIARGALERTQEGEPGAWQCHARIAAGKRSAIRSITASANNSAVPTFAGRAAGSNSRPNSTKPVTK